jgi:hypothetical protein
MFLAYLNSDASLQMIEEGPRNHISTLVSLGILTGASSILYWFWEQVCIIACPTVGYKVFY